MMIRPSCVFAIGLLTSVWLGDDCAAAGIFRPVGWVCDQNRCRPQPRSRSIRIAGSHGYRWDHGARFWAVISADLNCCRAPTPRFFGYSYGPEIYFAAAPFALTP
jgi:hypothetical protein